MAHKIQNAYKMEDRIEHVMYEKNVGLEQRYSYQQRLTYSSPISGALGLKTGILA